MTKETTDKLKTGGWGMALGAVIAIVLGFTLGGWMTEKSARIQSKEAVLASLSEICVSQFKSAADYDAQLVKFKELESWKRREFVEKGGWDVMPGEEVARIYVSNGCSEGLETMISN